MMQELGLLLNNFYSEEWRMECEARYVLSIPKEKRKLYLADVEGKRGKQARLELESEIMKQWTDKKSTKA